MIVDVAFLILLLAASAFFSATETAYTSLASHDVELLAETRGRRGRIVQRLLRRPSLLLTTILVGNNLANIGAAAVVTLMTEQALGTRMVSVMSGALTLIVLIFCEVTPKRIAIANNHRLALATSYPLVWLGYALRPLILVVTGASSIITRFFVRGDGRRISQDAIVSLITAGENQGIVKKYEGRMMRSVFHLDDIPVDTIMTPRNDVFSVQKSESLRSVLSGIIEHGYSRIPVHDGNLEHIVGILLVKDVVHLLATGNEALTVGDVMTDPLFVPETWKVNELFSLLQNDRLKMAIVIDQYGGLAGVVTVEDIAEEIFGEIYDETDPGMYDVIKKVSDRTYRVAADTSVPMLENAIGISLPDSRPDQTLGAYVLDSLEHIPEPGEAFDVAGFRLVIERISRNRIRSVLIEISPPFEDGRT